MRVWVRKEDIEEGTRHRSRFCPIALALWRQMGTATAVGTSSVCVGSQAYELSPEGRLFVKKFDRGEEVRPCYVSMRRV